jgi:hypothetical protein
MPLGKMNIFGNRQIPPQPNQNFQAPLAPGQFRGSNYSPLLGRGLQKFLPMMGGQSSLPMPPGFSRIFNGLLPQNPGQQQMPYLTPPTQGYPSQGYPSQGYPPHMPAPQGYNQGYGEQRPVQPAWEQPKSGGIKGFISNFMAKWKK